MYFAHRLFPVVFLVISLTMIPSLVNGQPGEVSLQTVTDAAGMFNQRGYLKSNSVIFDGKEAINSFNGNLMYTQVLETIRLSQNGLNCELKLTYNGSVGHISPSGLKGDVPELKRAALNMPEWILSVNNIAIQVLNFETSPVSWPTAGAGATLSVDDDVVALVNGYHNCYTYSNFTGLTHGTISILTGDGSVRQFVSLANGDHADMALDGGVYIGEYRTLSKDDRGKGWVTNNGDFYLLEADGTTIRFKLEYAEWQNMPNNQNSAPGGVDDKIIVALPYSFWSRYGGYFDIWYFQGPCDGFDYVPGCGDLPACCAGTDFFGRKPVKMFFFGDGSDLQFSWDPFSHGGGMAIRRGDNNRWIIYYDDENPGNGHFPGACDETNRAYVTRIVDPEGRNTFFEYSEYKRNTTGVGNGYSTSYLDACSNQTVNTHMSTAYELSLDRLHKITYPDGGQSVFSYLDDELSLWPLPLGSNYDELTVDFSTTCTNPVRFPCNKSDAFNDVGRDPFFVNMVVAARRLQHDGQGYNTVVSTDSLEFSWTDNSPTDQVSANDVFSTVRWHGQDDDFGPGGGPHKRVAYTYHQFPESGPYSDLERDRGWVVKLTDVLAEAYEGESGTLTMETHNTWITDNNIFQIESVETTVEGVTTVESYEYDWVGEDTATAQSNILWQKRTDPWGIITEKFYNDAYLAPTLPNQLYYNTLVDSVRTTVVPSGGGTVRIGLAKNEYYEPSDPNGITGQPKRKVVYELDAVPSGRVLDSLVESYQYYYSDNEFGPFGAARKVVDPGGDSVVFTHSDVRSVEYNRLGLDQETTTELLPFGDNVSWYKKTAYLSEDEYEWLTLSRVDTSWIVVDHNLGMCESGSTSVTIPCDQEIKYRLCIGRDNCDDGETNDVWIKLNGLTVDTTFCTGSDLGDKWQQGTLVVSEGDVLSLHVRSVDCPKKASTARPSPDYEATWPINRARVTYYDCSTDFQGVGIRERDAIVTYQHVDERGLPELVVGPNMYSANLSFDELHRVQDVTLPGSYPPAENWDPIPVAAVLSANPILDATYELNERLLDCPDWVLYVSDAPRYAYLSFQDLDLSDVQSVTSATLTLYCLGRDDPTCGIKVGTSHTSYPECGGMVLRNAGTTTHSAFAASTTVQLDVTSEIQNWLSAVPKTILFQYESAGQSDYFASANFPDMSLRPVLEIDAMVRVPQGTPVKPYSVAFEYDDNPGTGYLGYDSDGDPVSVRTEVPHDATSFGRTSEVTFDGFGRAYQGDAFSSETEYTSTTTAYDFADRAVTQTDQLTKVTSLEYDGFDRSTKTTHPDTYFTTLDYSGTTASAIGLPSGFEMEHDGIFKTTFTDENGNSVDEYTDVRGLLRMRKTSSSPGTEEKTFFDYDIWGNLITVIKPKGDSVNYRYNSLGQLTKEWAADYDTIFYRYDKSGNMVLKKDGELNAATGIEDSVLVVAVEVYRVASGSTIADTLVAGTPGIAHYNIGLTSSEDVDDATAYVYLNGTAVDYIRASNCEPSCSSTGHLFVSWNDTIIVEVTLGQGDMCDSAYASAAYWVYNDTESWTFYDYDALDRITASGKINLVETCDATSCWFSDTLSQNYNRRWFYDQEDSELSKGRLSLAADILDLYAEKFDYDARGRVLRQTDYFAPTTNLLVSVNVKPDPEVTDRYEFFVHNSAYAFETDYEYNLADQVTQITYPLDYSPTGERLFVTYHYDDRGRLESVGRIVDDVEDPDFFAAYTYTDRDEMETMTLGNGLQQVDYVYNDRGWLTSINDDPADAGTAVDRFRQELYYYAYTTTDTNWTGYKNGNVLAQHWNIDGFGDPMYRYSYDDMDRLTGWDKGVNSDDYAYDPNGNRTSLVSDGHTWSYEYDEDNQLDTVMLDGVLTMMGFRYDASGNVTQRMSEMNKVRLFHYDDYNQLDRIHDPSTVWDQVTFGYSPGGLRVKKWYCRKVWVCDDPDPLPKGLPKGGGGGLPGCDSVLVYDETYYVRGVTGNVLAEFADLDEAPMARYIYAGSQRIAMIDSEGDVYYYLNDHLGSAGVVINSSGTAMDKYRYKPFGNTGTSSSNLGQSYRYTGKPRDEELGLEMYYYGARYYDPYVGRFMSIDPLASKYPGWGPYVYVLDNPLRYTDPDGRQVGPDAARAKALSDRKAGRTDRSLENMYNLVTDNAAVGGFICYIGGIACNFIPFAMPLQVLLYKTGAALFTIDLAHDVVTDIQQEDWESLQWDSFTEVSSLGMRFGLNVIEIRGRTAYVVVDLVFESYDALFDYATEQGWRCPTQAQLKDAGGNATSTTSISESGNRRAGGYPVYQVRMTDASRGPNGAWDWDKPPEDK